MSIARITLILLGLSSLVVSLLLAAKTIFLLMRGVRTFAIIYFSEKGRYIRYRVGERLIDIEYRQILEHSESNTLDDDIPVAVNTEILYDPAHPKFYILATFFNLYCRPLLFFGIAVIAKMCMRYT